MAIGNFGKEIEQEVTLALGEGESGNIETYDNIREKARLAGTKPEDGQKRAVVYDAVFKLDLKALGLPDNVRAIDLEQRISAGKKTPAKGKNAGPDLPPVRPETLKQRSPGVFELPIRRHDFALILIE